MRGTGTQLKRRLDKPAAVAGVLGAVALAVSVGAGFGSCAPKAQAPNAEANAATQVEPIAGAATPGSANQAAGDGTQKGGSDMSGNGAESGSAGGGLTGPWADLPLDGSGRVALTEAQWRERLTPTQFAILRGKGTDRAYSGTMWKTNEPGEYRCAGCGNLLFVGDSKFISECGWPAFDKAIKGSIGYHEDNSYGMSRVEVTCSRCGGHLGHVFDDGPTATGTRYCINQTSIAFIPQSQVTRKDVPEQEARIKP